MDTRTIGGCEIRKPASVMGLETIRRLLAEGDLEAALRATDAEIEHRWAVDGFWRGVHLEQVWDA